MYGTQTTASRNINTIRFENDVKMYGTQTCSGCYRSIVVFENDVKMYGTQTVSSVRQMHLRLRMM